MSRGEHIYNYPLYSLKRFFTFLKYSKPIAQKVSSMDGRNYFSVLLDMIWCNLRYGAMDSRDYWLFEFFKKSASERNSFFTKRRYFRLIKKFDRKTFVQMCEKDFMYKEFKDFIKRDWLLVNQNSSEDTILSFIKEHGKVLVKPVSDEQGKGVCKIEPLEKDKIKELVEHRNEKPFLLEEVLVNHPELDKINSNSLNTLRIFTIVPKGEKPKVISVSLRCGVGKTAVDNWGAGGICYPVDLNYGIVFSYGKNKKGVEFAVHPETDIQMIGMKIPYYREAIQLALQSTTYNPNVLYAGCDVAITPNGPELIELNFPGGHDILQAIDNVGKNSIMQTIV